MESDRNLLSIGALSRAVGVPIETLRTWERRYGAPKAERTESGHRRYSVVTVERLLLVTQALDRGHPPSTALRLDVAALRELLGSVLANAAIPTTTAAVNRTRPHPAELEAALDPWFERVLRFEARAFDRELRLAWAELGAMTFVEHRAGPFLTELGLRWARGALGVAHEHFASERLREFLVQQWRPMSDAATGSHFVCATPSGEPHVLGLHMAALTLAMHNGRVVFLGADAPAADIAETARYHSAAAVVLSVSAFLDITTLRRELVALRDALPDSIAVWGGGIGFQIRTRDGACHLDDFAELARCLDAPASRT
jgi:methanogenic corrinoid protein MtbC1